METSNKAVLEIDSMIKNSKEKTITVYLDRLTLTASTPNGAIAEGSWDKLINTIKERYKEYNIVFKDMVGSVYENLIERN